MGEFITVKFVKKRKRKMLVNQKNHQAILETLAKASHIAVDCETSGLRPYNGDQLIGVAFSTGDLSCYLVTPLLLPGTQLGEPELTLPQILRFNHIFENPIKTLYMHNAKFDMAFLHNFGFTITSTIHCTKAIGRVLYNEHLSYSLDACAERDLGQRKDDTVKRYITDHKLWDWEEIPGKKCRRKNLHFDKVPLDILAPYAIRDSQLTYRLGRLQEERIDALSGNTPDELANVKAVFNNERDLTRTVFNIERTGIRIDHSFCREGIQTQGRRQAYATSAFEQETGTGFIDSSKLLAKVLEGERKWWGKTPKGSPSFKTEFLQKMRNPIAKHVIAYRDAKAKSNFLLGFLYHADRRGDVHPTFDPAGTQTGRFSSSNPNFQNLEKEGSGLQVRKGIIPRDGFVLTMFDYEQMEYRMMLEYAQEGSVICKVLEGLDVHTATAELMNVDRNTAKTINFMLLYGGGIQKLADALDISFKEASNLKQLYFDRLPNVQAFIQGVTNMAAARGSIFNWAGRTYHFPNPNFAYRACNYLVQGGCADVVKFAMNKIDRLLAPLKSRMILQVHDEIVVEVHEKELVEIPPLIKKIMEEAYPAKRLPLTVGVEHSWKSLAEKVKGMPNG